MYMSMLSSKIYALASSSFFSPLQSSLLLSKGTGPLTSSRASTATVQDFEGLTKLCKTGEARFKGARRVENLDPNAETLVGSLNDGWTVVDATHLSIAGAGNFGGLRIFLNFGGSKVYTVRFEIQGTAGRKVNIYFGDQFTLTKGGGIQWTFDGTVQQVSFKVTGGAPVESYTLNFDTRSYFGIPALTGADLTQTIYWHKRQIEEVTGQTNQNPSEYISPTENSIGALGVKYFETINGNTVAGNVMTEATGTPIPATTLQGALVEPAATNLCLQSNTFTTSPWIGTALAGALQNAVGINGNANEAWTLLSGYFYQNHPVTAGTTYTKSFYIKKTTGALTSYPVVDFEFVTNNIGLVTIDTTNGVVTPWTAYTGWTIIPCTATCISHNISYWRVAITLTVPSGNTSVNSFNYMGGATTATQATGTVTAGTNTVVMEGVQIEQCPAATSYIPTTTAAVARAADVLTAPTAGNLVAAQGSVYGEVTNLSSAGPIAMFDVYLDGNNYIDVNLNYTVTNALTARKQTFGAAVVSLSSSNNSCPLNALSKWAISYGPLGIILSVNGTSYVNSGAAVMSIVPANFKIGCQHSNVLQGVNPIKSYRTWTTQLTQAELNLLTAP